MNLEDKLFMEKEIQWDKRVSRLLKDYKAAQDNHTYLTLLDMSHYSAYKKAQHQDNIKRARRLLIKYETSVQLIYKELEIL